MPLKGSVLFSSLVSWGHMCAPPFMLNYYYSSIFKFYRCFLNVSYCCFTFSVVMNIQITRKMTILLYLNAEKMFSFVSGIQSRKAVRPGWTVDDLIWSYTTYVFKLPVGTLIYLSYILVRGCPYVTTEKYVFVSYCSVETKVFRGVKNLNLKIIFCYCSRDGKVNKNKTGMRMDRT